MPHRHHDIGWKQLSKSEYAEAHDRLVQDLGQQTANHLLRKDKDVLGRVHTLIGCLDSDGGKASPQKLTLEALFPENEQKQGIAGAGRPLAGLAPKASHVEVAVAKPTGERQL